MTLRWRIQALVAAAMLPLLALLLVDAVSHWRGAVRFAERQARDTAQALAQRLEATLDGARHTLTGIVLRVQDEGVDAAACANYLSAAVAGEPRYLSAAVATPLGRLWCRSDPGPAVVPPPQRELLANARDTDGLIVGDIVPDALRESPVLPLALAYRDAGQRVLGVAFLSLDLSRVAGLLAAQLAPDRGFAIVIDRHGTVGARTSDLIAAAPLYPVSSAITDAFGDGRTTATLEQDGRTFILAMEPVVRSLAGVSVIVGLDRGAALAAARADLLRDVGLAALAVAVILLAVWTVARQVVARPMERLVTTAERQRAGDLTARFPAASSDEFGRLGAALNAMAERGERAAGETQLQLREVHHRVMNSFHLLGAILHLHSRQIDNEISRHHLDSARQRIAAVSAVYRHLHESDATSTVEFGGVLRRFCEEMALAAERDSAAVEVEADVMVLPVETALALALMAHELITNVVKHAYGGTAGPLRVELRHEGTAVALAVTDWGKGLPSGFTVERARSLGMVVIRSLARQLRGEVVVASRPRGTRIEIHVTVPGVSGQGAAARPSLVA